MPSQTASPPRPAGKGAISVVIPALNEQEAITASVASALSAPEAEVIVADGGSNDATAQRARAAGARVIRAPRGSRRQLNAGAAQARGEMRGFLHADTLLPLGWQHEARRILAQPGVAAGAFRFRLDQRTAGLRLIELGVAARCRLLGMPYGDQGLFLTCRAFWQAGGFPELPIMEDCVLVRRLKRQGSVAISPAPAVTSARRWQNKGALATTLLNSLVLGGFFLGLSPDMLRRLYDRA
jgi:rSAM/selenodomain-associated transferase 2